METFFLKNLTANSDLSFALSEFVDAAESQGMKVEVKRESDNTKGGIVLEIAIMLGGGVVTNAIYDLLKYSLKRLDNRLSGKTPIEINEKTTTVDEVCGDS